MNCGYNALPLRCLVRRTNTPNPALVVLTGVFFVFVLSLAGEPAQGDEDFRIGVIAPQAAGTVGAAQQQETGIRVALEEARKRWGLRVRIEACDDRSDPQLTVSCAMKLAEMGVVAIVGSVNSLCSLELPKIAQDLHLPVVSAISTATRLTRVVPVSDTQPTWFFRAALNDRSQMQGLAQWLSSFRSLKPDEIAFVFEDSNEFVQHSSDEATRKSGQDVYGWGLRQDFLEAEPWQTYALKPIGVGIPRGAITEKPTAMNDALEKIASERKNRNNRPVRALGLFTLWDDARDIATFIRHDANRSRVQQALGLSGNDEPLLFAGSGAFSPDFYRMGGSSVVGAYLLSPFFVGESSATWREFRSTLASHQVDSLYPDPYLALGYDSVSMIASCLSSMSQGKKYGSTTTETISGRRTALRNCLAAGVETNASPSLVTGLKGFDKSGEALRELAQTTYILRVGPSNTLIPATSDDLEAAQTSATPWWRPDVSKILWALLGVLLALASVALLRSRKSERKPIATAPVTPAVAALPADKPDPVPGRPPRAATGEATWLASQHFFGSDSASQLALKVARNACLDQNDRKPVIIMGPTGVGKSQLAHLIHKTGPRGTAGKPYIVVDCATITESLFDSELAGATRGAYTGAVANRIGLLEAADGGTVLFDEIAEIRPELQARILRFLQNGEIRPLGSTTPRKLDVRVIAATNKDLAAFRPDMWARLSQGNLVISVPPLDAHWWDIPEYVDGLLERFGTGVSISDQALEILTACSWTNNFRSLGCLNEDGMALGLLGEISGAAPGSIVTPHALLSVPGCEPQTQRELAHAIETLGIVLPPPERPDAIFPEGLDSWFAKSDPRRAWEFVLDTVFNRLRGPRNENFLLASRDAKRLAVSSDELAVALGLSGRDAVLKSLRDAGVLRLPENVREKELSENTARRWRRQLILFTKRTQFVGLSHEELAEVCGVNRTKYYNFYRYAFRLGESICRNGVTPPMSRYVIDHRGEAERSDRRPPFADENLEKRAGQMTESFAGLRKLQLLPGRARLL
jgi:hypothetical protein